MSPVRFVTTRWSLLRSASDPVAARDALSELCSLYWRPLFVCARLDGHAPDEAEDLVQDFFARLLEPGALAGLDPAKGRFRSWLRTAFRHHSISATAAARTARRGGRHHTIPLDVAGVEGDVEASARRGESADTAFDRAFAAALLDAARARALETFPGTPDLARVLDQRLLPGVDDEPLQVAAAGCGQSEGALRVALHRYRQRFGRCLIEAIERTLDEGEDPRAEIGFLLQVLGRPPVSDSRISV